MSTERTVCTEIAPNKCIHVPTASDPAHEIRRRNPACAYPASRIRRRDPMCANPASRIGHRDPVCANPFGRANTILLACACNAIHICRRHCTRAFLDVWFERNDKEVYEQNQYNYAMGLSDINTFSFAQSRKDDAHNNYISASLRVLDGLLLALLIDSV